jgi:transposase InsO family protein
MLVSHGQGYTWILKVYLWTICFLLDAYSKWLDIVVMKNITTRTTIEKLQGIFTTHGFPEIVVSDNGPTFTSKEIEQFTARNGIRHIKAAPYHPASNGCAERAVQTFKTTMTKILEEPSKRK